jgi:hypothetical protein
MSLIGKKTPLQLNVEAALNNKQGLRINPTARDYQGSWTADSNYSTPTTGSYTQGSITAGTVLEKLTSAFPNFYNLTPSVLCVQVWRNLLTIGRPPQNTAVNCPALGNSRPDTFQTSYAGWGTFRGNSTVDQFYNAVAGSDLGLVEEIYPPYGYPTDSSGSYITTNWGSTTASPGWPTDCTQTTFSPYTDTASYLHKYAWITGWPANYSWQAKTTGNPQISTDPSANSDTYAAAYFPRPDLAPTQPWRSRDLNKIEYDEYFSRGFVATVARQAYYEFWSESTNRRPNQYTEFSKAFQQGWIYKNLTNASINSYTNTQTFLKGTYSNINDITSSDISGVSLAFKDFGNDMINLGKTVDLYWIHLFGLPSKLLLTLQQNNSLTEALRLALLYVELDIIELENILDSAYTPDQFQEAKIYKAFELIQGDDLGEIRVINNIATTGLISLADLLDPKKMFPNSWPSLTIPEYSIEATTSKVYSPIYSGDGVNTSIRNWGDYLVGILPGTLPIACGAFMMTMNQIKNIRQMEWEKLSQVVSNLEVTNKGLNLVDGQSGVPGSVQLAQDAIDRVALGSGIAGAYRQCDFFGAMAGIPYLDWYNRVQELLIKLSTPQLQNIYTQLYNLSVSGVFTSTQIQTLIDQANTEIYSIQIANPDFVAELNTLWDNIGRQLTIEQRAIPLGINRTENVYEATSSNDVSSFTSSIEEWALDTVAGGAAPILEAISDTSGIGGQSLVAALREARNAVRISNLGGELDNNVSSDTPCPIPLRATVLNGQLTSVDSEGTPGGYDDCDPPPVTVLPQGGVFGVGVISRTGVNTASNCKFIVPVSQYPDITAVTVNWITGLGTVTSAVLVGPNYEITVDGACFENGVEYTFYSPRLNPGQNGSTAAIIDKNGNIAGINIVDGGGGYTVAPTVLVDCPPPPVRLGGPIVPGSFAGSPWMGQDPVPDNLVTDSSASYSVDEALTIQKSCGCQ